MRATVPEGERRRKVGSVGIKKEEKRKEMERRSFAQPSITFLGFKFIWLHFFLFEIHSTQERSWGMGRKTEGENSMRRERKRGKEVGSNILQGRTTWVKKE